MAVTTCTGRIALEFTVVVPLSSHQHHTPEHASLCDDNSGTHIKRPRMDKESMGEITCATKAVVEMTAGCAWLSLTKRVNIGVGELSVAGHGGLAALRCGGLGECIDF
jgi:hypothetical protein